MFRRGHSRAKALELLLAGAGGVRRPDGAESELGRRLGAREVPQINVLNSSVPNVLSLMLIFYSRNTTYVLTCVEVICFFFT